MITFDLRKIGNKLLAIRKRAGLTQSEVAEAANMSDRTYADIERGTVNMRIETVLRICDTLRITPDVLFTEENPELSSRQSELFDELASCTVRQRETALALLEVYLRSLK